ncbi:hypothetical protein D9757_002733 [Collybiopsis confluens]|uniref:EF-hand domain-containing protein n=1 Tax=Collybiopsis confluens TaxID=2823264 RepID=A0A8H5HW78_9AGAR|nr:hypothetical protein D9757_002733 [Collybiopsis confluens]
MAEASSPPPRSLAEFREREGRTHRKERLNALWQHICKTGYLSYPGQRAQMATPNSGITADKAEQLRASYEAELMGKCGAQSSKPRIRWTEFKSYALAKEVELWNIFHNELDLDHNGRLELEEFDAALRRSKDILLSPATLEEFMTFLTSRPHSPASFSEFRDFFLLLPRKISPEEIYKYYQVARFLGDDGRGAARVTMEGDVSLSAEDKPPALLSSRNLNLDSSQQPPAHFEGEREDHLEPEGHDPIIGNHTALKFLLAGGIAGAVSRTCTAPFDRLKIFLITRPQDLTISSGPNISGLKAIGNAVTRIYAEGGLLAFWTGNGLSVAKIFPESAIKFFTYESSKRAFAKYWDHVDDPRDISGFSRFVSGGLGGITSQLSIYPIETLKTQIMSSSGQQKRTLIEAARHVWAVLPSLLEVLTLGQIGLIGVFPYSAIDMSTFEMLKLTYVRSTGKEEPGVLALLAFGSLSGSVGAASVYPMNLVRTRMQASGSPGHPQTYNGWMDVVMKTWEQERWRGFYRGLIPTLSKVVPAVSISYVVYEHSKRRLGV